MKMTNLDQSRDVDHAVLEQSTALQEQCLELAPILVSPLMGGATVSQTVVFRGASQKAE